MFEALELTKVVIHFQIPILKTLIIERSQYRNNNPRVFKQIL